MSRNGEQQIREEEQQQQEVVAKADIITPASKQPPATIDSGSAFDINPAEFKIALNRRKENRAEMIKWIRGHLVNGVDYHELKGKKFLGKSGAEKILSLLGCVARYPNLEDWERILIEGKSMPETIVIRCEVWRGAAVLAEGIGARSLEQDSGIVNKVLKMAKKSATLDAVLGLGLSEIFSQDYEEVQQSINNAPPPPPPPPAKKYTPPPANTAAKSKTADGTKLGEDGLAMIKEIKEAVNDGRYKLRDGDTFFNGEKGFFARTDQYGAKVFCSAAQRNVIEKAIAVIHAPAATQPPNDNFSDMDDVPF